MATYKWKSKADQDRMFEDLRWRLIRRSIASFQAKHAGDAVVDLTALRAHRKRIQEMKEIKNE